MSFKTIINPQTNQLVSIYSKEGKNIIANYLRVIQNGGATKNLPVYNLGKEEGYPCDNSGQNNVSTAAARRVA